MNKTDQFQPQKPNSINKKISTLLAITIIAVLAIIVIIGAFKLYYWLPREQVEIKKEQTELEKRICKCIYSEEEELGMKCFSELRDVIQLKDIECPFELKKDIIYNVLLSKEGDIKIFNEDKKLLQTIKHEDNFSPTNFFALFRIVKDVNFNGYNEIALLYYPGMQGGMPIDLYLYNPISDKFEKDENLWLVSPQFLREEKKIVSTSPSSHGRVSIVTYSFEDGRYIPVEKERYDYDIDDYGDFSENVRIIEKKIGDKWIITKEILTDEGWQMTKIEDEIEIFDDGKLIQIIRDEQVRTIVLEDWQRWAEKNWNNLMPEPMIVGDVEIKPNIFNRFGVALFFPSKNRIVFTVHKYMMLTEIVAVSFLDLESGEISITNITMGEGLFFEWSPDEKMISYTTASARGIGPERMYVDSISEGKNIFIVDHKKIADILGFEDKSSGDFYPYISQIEWAEDSKKIYFETNVEINVILGDNRIKWIIDSDGTNLTRLKEENQ